MFINVHIVVYFVSNTYAQIHCYNLSLKIFSAVNAGSINASLFPQRCERTVLSLCRPFHPSQPFSSVTWGHRSTLPELRTFVRLHYLTETTEGGLQLDLKVLRVWILPACFLCQQNTWESKGAKYSWSFADMGGQVQFNPLRALAQRSRMATVVLKMYDYEDHSNIVCHKQRQKTITGPIINHYWIKTTLNPKRK